MIEKQNGRFFSLSLSSSSQKSVTTANSELRIWNDLARSVQQLLLNKTILKICQFILVIQIVNKNIYKY